MSKRRAWPEKTKSSKIENLKKKPQITYELFFPFFPIPAGPYVKMIPRGALHSTPANKTEKNSHLNSQNGPYSRKCYYIVLYKYSH